MLKIKDNKYVIDLKNKLERNRVVLSNDELYNLDQCSYMNTPDVKEEYYYLNNGVGTCIQIKRVPRLIGRGIMNSFKGIPNIMITIDDEHIDNKTAVTFLSGSLSKMRNKSEIVSDQEEIDDMKEDYGNEDDFKDYLRGTKENCKAVTIRFYVTAKDLESLQSFVDRINNIFHDKKMYGAIQRNIVENDLQALSSLSAPIKDMLTTKSVVNMMVSDNIQQIMPSMFALGETETGRPYCPDFLNYNIRSYNVCLVGLQSSGKSSVLKSMIQSALMRREQVIIIDVHNKEYQALANRYHIPSIEFDTNKFLNPFQIYNNDETTGAISELCIANVVMLNQDILRIQGKITNENLLVLYSNTISDMYSVYDGCKVEDIKNEEWFIGSDVLNTLLKNIECNYYPQEKLKDVYDLIDQLKLLVNTYGFFFNRNTNISFNMYKSFRIDLSAFESSNTSTLRDGYLALIYSFLGKLLLHNEKINKEYEKLHTLERPKFPLTVATDETGTLLKEEGTCRVFDIFSRQVRKARAQFLFAIHTIKDIEGATSAHTELVKSIFSLVPTFIIGQVDPETASKLSSYVNGLTEEDTTLIKEFRTDERTKKRKFMTYTTDNKKRIVFWSYLSKRQELLFGGGR